MSLYEVAKNYRDAGLSVVASDKIGTNLQWKQYKERVPTDAELKSMFTPQYDKICVICGAGSGNLEVIDVDTKNDASGTIWQRLSDALLDYYNGQPPFAIVETRSKGVHLYYKCETIEGNQHLSENLFESQVKANIETRGIGGLVMAPPTEGYKSLDGRFPYHIPTITPDEREDILTICRSFNEILKVAKDKPKGVSPQVYKLTPWDSYNENLNDPWRNILTESGWTMVAEDELYERWRKPNKTNPGHSATWNKETRQFYVFASNAIIPPGPHRPFDIYCIIKCAGKTGKAASELRKEGYGAKFNEMDEGIISKAYGHFAGGLDYDSIVELLTPDWQKDFSDVKDVTLPQLVSVGQSRFKSKSGEFWFVNDKGKYCLDKAALGDFLKVRGYRLLVDTIHAESYRLVKIEYERHLIEQMYPDLIRKDIEAWITSDEAESQNIPAIRNLIRSITDANLKIAIEHLPRVPLKTINFLRDSEDPELTSWLPFSNCVVKITKDNHEDVAYTDLPENSLIWKKYIIDFPINLSSDLTEEELNQSTVWLFLKRISGITKDMDKLDPQALQKANPVVQERFNAIITTLGYFLCNHKNKSQPYFPILGEDIADDKQGGGTGKGIFMEIVSKLRNVVIIDAKIWSATERFPFQLVKLGTDIVFFDDMPKNFPFEKLYSVITTGMTIENKNEKSFYIPYEQSPKLGGSTNYDPDDSSDAAARRQKKVYFSRYFNKDYQPAQEFGVIFGPQWTEYDYQLFYNILFQCLRMYMKYGILPFPETANTKNKSLVIDMGSTFKSYVDDFVKEHLGKWKHKKEFLQEAMADLQKADEKYYTADRLDRNLKKYAIKMGLHYEEKKNWHKTAGHRNNKYIIFTQAGFPLPEMNAETILISEASPSTRNAYWND